MQSYDELLKRGMAQVPEKTKADDRFEVPKAHVMRAGLKTIVTNFNEIVTALRRKPDHLLKFLLKELATKYEWSGNQLIFQGKFPPELIDKKIDLYVKTYVVCPECKKPDSKIIREGIHSFLKCEACGAKHVISKV